MPIDISLQFNGHNSFRATETVRSQPFGVQGMDWITHSFHAMANSNLNAAVRAETRFYQANGMLLSKVSHSFPVPTLWDKVVITVAVPALAVLAQVALLPGPTTWWWAEAKSEEGQTATPYNINYAGQLTKLTPTGAYTGLLSVEQIVVRGTQLNPEENLGQRLLTINSSLISMINDLGAKGQLISNIEGGLVAVTNTFTSKTSKLTPEGLYTDKVKANQVQTGLLQSSNANSWINMDDGRFSFGNGALAWNGTDLGVIGSLTTKTGGAAPAKISVSGGKLELFSADNKSLGFISNSGYFVAGETPGLSIFAGRDAKLLDIGFLLEGGGPAPYIRLNAISSGKPQIQLYGQVELTGRITTDNLLVKGSSYIGIIKHPVTNKNIFNPYTDATWISSPNEASHVRISNDSVQIIRNGAVVASW